jgi:hypothetical protein
MGANMPVFARKTTTFCRSAYPLSHSSKTVQQHEFAVFSYRNGYPLPLNILLFIGLTVIKIETQYARFSCILTPATPLSFPTFQHDKCLLIFPLHIR